MNTEHTQVLMEYGKRDELKNVYTYGNERIAAETLTQTYNPNEDQYATDYYIYDGRGSVAQVLRADEIVQSYSYDPFGNVTSGAPEFDSFYGYNAEDTNPVTGLQYLRARYYDTATGRFDVADTYLGDISAPLTLNRYSYAVNNPVMLNDPSGHWPNWVKKAANWVNNKVVKPVVNTAKNVANWVNEKVIQPVKKAATNAADWVNTKVIQPITNALTPKPAQILGGSNNTTNQKTTSANTTFRNNTTGPAKGTVPYILQRTEEIKRNIVQVYCGTADKMGKQSANHSAGNLHELIYEGHIDPTGDMNYGDMSEDDLKRKLLINKWDFESYCEQFQIIELENLAKLTTTNSDYNMETVVLDMIDHFKDGSGTPYTNQELTNAVAAHESTQRFMKDFTEQFKNAMKQYDGNYSEFANSEDFRWDYLRPNNVFISKYDYGGGLFEKDTWNGLTMAIHGWTGVEVTLTDFKKNGDSYSGTFQFMFYDNFGLDDGDFMPYALAHGGFKAWYILQHYDGYNKKYKPFETQVTLNYDFSGSFE